MAYGIRMIGMVWHAAVTHLTAFVDLYTVASLGRTVHISICQLAKASLVHVLFFKKERKKERKKESLIHV